MFHCKMKRYTIKLFYNEEYLGAIKLFLTSNNNIEIQKSKGCQILYLYQKS